MKWKTILTVGAMVFNSTLFGQTPANEALEEPCGFYNIHGISDPVGDATLGSPAYADILGLTIKQMGQYVQFEWLAGGNVVNDELEYYVLAIDTDRNPDTGQSLGGAGAELKISIETFPEGPSAIALLAYLDPDGQTVLKIERDVPVVLTNAGFILNIEKSKIPVDHFNLNFLALGPWYDEGTLTEIQLQAAEASVQVRIESLNTVLESNPPLINIPEKSTGVKLSASLVSNGVSTPLDPSKVSYTVSHPVSWLVSSPETIISIDGNAVAHYNSEGYVTVTAEEDVCHLVSKDTLLATGDVYGNPLTDEVIAVFPPDYKPDSSAYSFGDMMSGYPDMMRYVNTAYRVTSEMYRGFRPFGGDKQILAPLVEDICGMPGNPLATAPCCYMNCGDASPQYGVIVHEMGHNFSLSEGMAQLDSANQSKIGAAGFGECVASLPVIYFEEEILHNGAAYKIFPGSFEHEYSRDNRETYCSSSKAGLEEFEQFITDGITDSVFNNPDLFDGVQVFCSFFESFSCDYVDGPNIHKHHMIRRFLKIFDDTELPEFIPEKVETYFAAAYGVAADRDMRTKLRFWGFTIDDVYYEQILPLIEYKARESLVFRDSFE